MYLDYQSEKYLVDTNVFVYCLDGTSPFHNNARRIIEHALEQQVELVVSHQNLVELTSVLTRAYSISTKKAQKDFEKLHLKKTAQFNWTTIHQNITHHSSSN